jgi:hypothetical protein
MQRSTSSRLNNDSSILIYSRVHLIEHGQTLCQLLTWQFSSFAAPVIVEFNTGLHTHRFKNIYAG